tara:strand:- start:1157 stop:1351 length:195 start_codon:yes stop_codon:yes gene_type:complete
LNKYDGFSVSVKCNTLRTNKFEVNAKRRKKPHQPYLSVDKAKILEKKLKIFNIFEKNELFTLNP